MTQNLQQNRSFVENVFSTVFERYDVMNDLMSFGAHRFWKSKLIDWMSPRQNQHLIDVASGTGDVARAFLKETNFSGKVSSVEPNKNMLICRTPTWQKNVMFLMKVSVF